MSTNITNERRDRMTLSDSDAALNRETAPSFLRDDQPTLARTLGMMGAALVIFGGTALAFNLSGKAVRISTGWAILTLAIGLAALLFHAAFDRDIQFRRLYMVFGMVLLVAGFVLSLLPFPKAMGDLLRFGMPCMMVALLFLLAFFRNEEEPLYRNLAQKSLQISGGIMAVAGLLFSMLRGDFLLPVGLVFAVVGLLYLAAYVGTRGISDDLAYYTAVGIALAGGIVLLITLGRSLISENGSRYFVSYGIILVFLAVLYITVGLIASSDRPLFILTRRELGAFFYSPIAYLALLGFSLCWWGSYWTFLSNLFESSGPQMIEPIVRNYYFSLVPVITLLALVPALTMRLLSEEMRSGTMEVLLTAPVDEPAIVLSKFLATLITYMVMWIPSGLFLLGITLSGGTPFDYRPMLSFILVVLVTGASFVSMGLFFSSLTKSQIASFVITFAAMIGLLVVYFAGFIKQDNTWETVFKHLSFLDLWFSTLEGKIVPKFLLFPLSMTVLFLFMTVKVLESRKWR